MSELKYNVDLLMQVREKIVSEPEKHYQGQWARAASDPRKGGDCGTAYCVAGWAAVLDGQQLDWYGEGGVYAAYNLAARDEYGGPISISRYARQALGLEYWEDTLFSDTNTRERVLAAMDLLIEAGKNGERVSRETFYACFDI